MSDSLDIDATTDRDRAATVDSARGAASRAPKVRFAVGDVIARRYRIDAYLAAGGMGEVYRAEDLELDVPLALKTVRRQTAKDPVALRRFKREVLLARSVSHPNVCRIFDLGRDESTGIVFLTMEFLQGETLAARIASQGALPRDASLPIVRQLAEALDAAHRAGVVHRDFKSSNVMLVPAAGGERVSITDFGLAIAVERDGARGEHGGASATAGERSPSKSQMTEAWAGRRQPHATSGSSTRRIVGTPAYMAPEQVAGSAVGPASDLYALGVVLFEMVTGRLPFRGATPLDAARIRLTTPPPRPSAFASMDAAWEETILRLLAREPGERFASALDAVAALEGRSNGAAITRHTLPAERDAFVGRTTELEALAAELESASGNARARLVTLHGPGGSGKTRLAQRYGWGSLSCWPGGVWFCDLSDARSVEGIAHIVAAALDVPLGAGDPVAQLGHAIAGRGPSLVILDNFEQVVDHAEATVGRWLERTVETAFLVTTRARLGLPEETVHAVEPLDPTTHGVELFDVRGRGYRAGFAVSDVNRPQVEAIVEKLDGLPLAIELAAARLRMLSLEQLHDRLGDRFRILGGGKRGRHATLAATLDWSWQLLTQWEQSAIAQASVFEGGFTLEAAEAVIDLSGHEEAPPVIDIMQSLIDQSWLRTDVVQGAARFEMYATVQEYASGKLGAHRASEASDAPPTPASLSKVEARHGSFFSEMGSEETLETLHGHGGASLRAALQRELDNLVVACRRAIARRDEEVAVASYAAVNMVLDSRGPVSTSIGLGHEVLGVLTEPRRRARVLRTVAVAELTAGEMAEAREHLEASLAIHRQVGDRRGEGFVLGNLGVLHHDQEELARGFYETALAIHREVGNRRLEAAMLNNIGILHGQSGRIEEAYDCYEAALAIHRETGDRRGEGITLGDIGTFHGRQGRLEKELEYLEAALAIHREVGNRLFEGVALGNLGVTLAALGRVAEARTHYVAGLAIHREVGHRRLEGNVLVNLGELHWQQARVKEAREDYDTALGIAREMGDRRLEGLTLVNLGALLQGQGELEEALEHYERARAILRDPSLEGVALGAMGSVLAALGRVEEARVRFDEGERLLRDADAPIRLCDLLCERAESDLTTGAIESARAALRELGALAARADARPETKLGRRLAELRRSLDAQE